MDINEDAPVMTATDPDRSPIDRLEIQAPLRVASVEPE